MRVRDWQDILKDVVESDADAGGWRAVAGDRNGGVGSRVARKIDDLIDESVGRGFH